MGKLPNILNVLWGHMSLVGPRAVPESDSTLDQNWVRNLLLVRPGLTGPAVDRPGGNSIENQTLKDIAYVRNYSLWLDIRLLFASVKRMLRRKKGVPPSYPAIDRIFQEAEVAVAPETVGRAT
jgi:lipopolysaccharide/colanic/teichoic acid biosynthesis glycosyltransferase